jgi:hypothetical protein
MRSLLWLTPLIVAGCASHRDGPADVSMHVPATAEQTVGCLVRALDAQFPGSAFFGGVDHHAVLIVPGQVYEVTPTRDLYAFGGENYFVRVTSEDTGSLMELHGPWNMVHALEPAMLECAA